MDRRDAAAAFRVGDHPRYADDATEALARAGNDLEAVRLAIAEVAAALTLWNVTTTELTAAAHDIEDATSHLGMARRGLTTLPSIGNKRARASIRILIDGAEPELHADLALLDAHVMLDTFADEHERANAAKVERIGDHRVIVTLGDGRRREAILEGCSLHL